MSKTRKFMCCFDEPLEISDKGLGSPDPESLDYNHNYEDDLAERYAEEMSNAIFEGRPYQVEMYRSDCKKNSKGKPYSKDYLYGESA